MTCSCQCTSAVLNLQYHPSCVSASLYWYPSFYHVDLLKGRNKGYVLDVSFRKTQLVPDIVCSECVFLNILSRGAQSFFSHGGPKLKLSGGPQAKSKHLLSFVLLLKCKMIPGSLNWLTLFNPITNYWVSWIFKDRLTSPKLEQYQQHYYNHLFIFLFFHWKHPWRHQWRLFFGWTAVLSSLCASENREASCYLQVDAVAVDVWFIMFPTHIVKMEIRLRLF